MLAAAPRAPACRPSKGGGGGAARPAAPQRAPLHLAASYRSSSSAQTKRRSGSGLPPIRGGVRPGRGGSLRGRALSGQRSFACMQRRVPRSAAPTPLTSPPHPPTPPPCAPLQDGGGGGGGGDGWGRAARGVAANVAFLGLYAAVTAWGGDGWGSGPFGEPRGAAGRSRIWAGCGLLGRVHGVRQHATLCRLPGAAGPASRAAAPAAAGGLSCMSPCAPGARPAHEHAPVPDRRRRR